MILLFQFYLDNSIEIIKLFALINFNIILEKE